MNPQKAVVAAVYCRISRDKTGAGLGVERQEADCRKLAKRLGWTVRKVYVDNDISAYSGRRRPQYEALLADIDTGHVSGVIAWHPDRLHRQPIELERYIDLSERRGVVTSTVKAGEWDLSTASGLLQARNIGNFAAYESRLRSERIRSAAGQRATKGDGAAVGAATGGSPTV